MTIKYMEFSIEKSRPGEDEKQDTLKEDLFAQIDRESIENFKSVVKRIYETYTRASNSHDKEELATCLMRIKNHYAYLYEKYRDTPEQREYILHVKKAIAHLEDAIQKTS